MDVVSDYIVRTIAKQVQEHRLVVWFNPDRHYADLVEQMSLPDIARAPYRGSFFALRHEVEPLMRGLLFGSVTGVVRQLRGKRTVF